MKAPASAALLPAPPLGSSKMPLLHRGAAAINGHGGKCSISSVPRIEKKLEEAGGQCACALGYSSFKLPAVLAHTSQSYDYP